MKWSRISLVAIALTIVAVVALSGTRTGHAADVVRQLMTVGTPIPVPRSIGRFDRLAIDEKYRRLLAAHTSSNELLVINLDSGEVERRVTVGPGRGVAVDVYDGKLFVGTDDGYVAQLNRRWLVENQRIYTNGPVGAVAFDPKNGRLYAAHVDGTEVWVVQGKTDKLLQFPVTVPKGPESLAYDPVTDKIYQNISSTSSVVVIDPGTNTVTATWPLAPATDPRGLAVDGKGKRLFSAGSNGKLVVLDLTSGRVMQTIDIPARADQIAYDESSNKLYCVSGTGLLSVIGDTGEGFDRIGDVTIPRGAHTLVIDPKTHGVWIAYGGDQNDYVVKLAPPPSPSPSPGASAPAQSVVSGNIAYVQRAPLPASAIAHVEIDDITLEDAPAVVISALDIPITHLAPIPFSLSYDPTKIDPKHRYALNVRVEADGKLLYLNKTRFPLFQNNAPTTGLEIRADPIP